MSSLILGRGDGHARRDTTAPHADLRSIAVRLLSYLLQELERHGSYGNLTKAAPSCR